jgi:hypothetical protein
MRAKPIRRIWTGVFVHEPSTAWEVALRAWRAASALVGLVQVPLIFAASSF